MKRKLPKKEEIEAAFADLLGLLSQRADHVILLEKVESVYRRVRVVLSRPPYSKAKHTVGRISKPGIAARVDPLSRSIAPLGVIVRP